MNCVSFAPAADRTTISRLRIRGCATDPMLARLRAGTLLSSAALAPPGLSPAAILVVRRLRDPMSGRLGLRGGGIRLPEEWERAVRSQVDVLARRALRPARDRDAETAEAVLFADYAELLACLARDWLHGTLQRWWWRTLFPNQNEAAAAVRAWLERPECITAAMAHLAASGDEAPFVARIGRAGVCDLLEAVLKAHALPELKAALAPAVAKESTTSAAAYRPARAHERVVSKETRNMSPPWRGDKIAAHAVFPDPVLDAFVGVCSVLHRRPHHARSREFAAQAGRWAAVQAEVIALPGSHAASASKEEIAIDTRPRDASLSVRRVVGQREHFSHARPGPEEIGSAQPVDEQVHGERPARAYEQTMPPALVPSRIDTRFGGVFFLVNLALFLGFYSDFTKPSSRGLALPLWDFVALVGEGLAGPALRADAVWKLLARLADRDESEEPGCALSPRRRLAVRRWLGRLIPRLRARLADALGVIAETDVSRVLLEMPARVWVTLTRVDVSFALAELPVAVRCSGLDRDPGWLPATGRSLYFHFD